MKYGLTDQQFQILDEMVISPLKSHGVTVWIFGSRARGDHKPFSDVDIVYETQQNSPLPQGFMSNLRDSLEESRLPYKVDIVDFREMADSYRFGVLSDRILL
jgi:predicted nucleotidyltransferase